MASLYDIAPRLARARDEWVLEQQRIARRRERARRELLRAERLLAHRDLQLVRAWNTGNRKYIAWRERKLDRSRADVERLRREAA